MSKPKRRPDWGYFTRNPETVLGRMPLTVQNFIDYGMNLKDPTEEQKEWQDLMRKKYPVPRETKQN